MLLWKSALGANYFGPIDIPPCHSQILWINSQIALDARSSRKRLFRGSLWRSIIIKKGEDLLSFIWIVFISSSRHFEPNLKGSTPGKYLKWRPHHKNINFPLNFTLCIFILDLCQNHHNCWLCKKNNKSLEFSNWNEKLLLYTHTVDTG